MKTSLAALLAGTLFGAGLTLSEMINPARVIGFLDVAGDWDMTLLLVMCGAVTVAFAGFSWVLKQPRPVLADKFSLPTKVQIDKPLLIGSALFGAGWGLAGFCPGPAIAALVTLSPSVIIFVLAMIAGQWLAARLEKSR
jgi:uncharacterized membrane protein YedE/YeeE